MRLFSGGISLIIGGTLVLCGLDLAISAPGEILISQKNKQFQPGSVTLEKGQPLVVANDDANVVHHAYVESDSFNFDSGDQNPGSRTKIVFPTKGDFQVLCGIHPTMKLDVHVK